MEPFTPHAYNLNDCYQGGSIVSCVDGTINPHIVSQNPHLPAHHDWHAVSPSEDRPALDEAGARNLLPNVPSMDNDFSTLWEPIPGPEPLVEPADQNFDDFVLSQPRDAVSPKQFQQQPSSNKPVTTPSTASPPSILLKSKRKACRDYTARYGVKCAEIFSNQKRLDNHIWDVHHLKVHRCPMTGCTHRTARLDNLRGHMKNCKMKAGSSLNSRSPMRSQPVRARTSRTRTSKPVLQSQSPGKSPLTSSPTFDITGLPTPLSSQNEDPDPSQQDIGLQSMNDAVDRYAADDCTAQNETEQLLDRVKALEEKVKTERNKYKAELERVQNRYKDELERVQNRYKDELEKVQNRNNAELEKAKEEINKLQHKKRVWKASSLSTVQVQKS